MELLCHLIREDVADSYVFAINIGTSKNVFVNESIVSAHFNLHVMFLTTRFLNNYSSVP